MKSQEEIIEKLKGKNKFIVLSYDGGVFDFYDIYAGNEDEAYQIIEEEITTNFSKEILLTPNEFKLLKEQINKFKI